MTVLENMILSLKIISKIPDNGRIKRTKTGIALDESSSIRRTINRDNRNKAISDITNIIEFIIEKCNDITNSKYHEKFDIPDTNIKKKMDTEYKTNNEFLELLKKDLENSVSGLLNLKSTYYSDTTITSRIDILISKIKSFLKKD